MKFKVIRVQGPTLCWYLAYSLKQRMSSTRSLFIFLFSYGIMLIERKYNMHTFKGLSFQSSAFINPEL